MNHLATRQNVGPAEFEIIGALNGNDLIYYLVDYFEAPVITTSEFRNFFKISKDYLRCMIDQGTAPRMISITEGYGEGRMLVADVAGWLENSAFLTSLVQHSRNGESRGKRGRKPKNQEVAAAS